MKWIVLVAAALAAIHFTLVALGRRALLRGAVRADQDDPEIQAAFHKARETAEEFLRCLAAPRPGQSSAAVKVALVEDAITEHAWLAEPRIDGDHFVGRLDK